jgi:hypothetical protein
MPILEHGRKSKHGEILKPQTTRDIYSTTTNPAKQSVDLDTRLRAAQPWILAFLGPWGPTESTNGFIQQYQ